ncbi:MAG: citrate lyase subunit alpha [Peptoniphilaceae bacterium]|nr:citrate lyase subunit alpha [Peptoniphilaceae bacterium]MDY6019548.1 citrate lyase subunit alpha [Anaerococcus sp.]
MKNTLGRQGLDRPYEGLRVHENKREYKFNKSVQMQELNFDSLFKKVNFHDGMTISFHHHLRNGDYVLNIVMEQIHKRGYKDICLAASSIFACHKNLVPMIEDGTVTKIYTSYMSGPVADAVSQGKLKDMAYITTHGERPRSILEGELKIDIAFVGVPALGKDGSISGSQGPSSCGSLGYAIADCQCANTVVAITDNLCEKINKPDLKGGFVDYFIKLDRIGDPNGIVSGTTKITKDPIGLSIARKTADLIDKLGFIKNGLSFQTGAGGVSLAVGEEVFKIMKEKNIKGSFGCGGITGFFVDMLDKGIFEKLEDVQCFDNKAVKSIENNPYHEKISASKYANPNDKCIVDELDVVVLGASEIDKNFNVNVTTGTDGYILGGSGGHADAATGAKLSIITTKLFNARISSIVDQVKTITTPGDAIDAVVTEYGIAINPKRKDLIKYIEENTKIKLVTMDYLYKKAISYTGKPKVRKKSDLIVAYSVYRDGTILDAIYNVNE